MEGEMRLENFFARTFQDKMIGTFGRAQVVGVEVTFFVEHFSEFHGNSLSAFALNFQTNPANHVLAHIVNIFTFWCGDLLDRFNLFNRFDRNTLRSN